DIHRKLLDQPFAVTGTQGKFSAQIKCTGGGVSGWAGAIRHGIARALTVADEGNRRALRTEGLLTRDSRVKERKKPGLKRARKAAQYTKR
ncbi:MAG: 30S ribosomal protein S9, partial [Chloroflexi bacterium]|nr:30S ribosomal protein S9 [Chloroflexota bacterium]